MSRPIIRTSVVLVSEVLQFALEVRSDPRYDDVVPITHEIAMSLQGNPYSDPQDPALVVAYVCDRCAGYLGVCAGRLSHGQIRAKVYWGTPFYVSPEFRTMGIGVLLVKKLLSLDIDFLGDAPSKHSEPIWRALGLMDAIESTSFTILNVRKLRVPPFCVVRHTWLQSRRDQVSQPQSLSPAEDVDRRFRHQVLSGVLRLKRGLGGLYRWSYPPRRFLAYTLLLGWQRPRWTDTGLQEVTHLAEAQSEPAGSSSPHFTHGTDWLNWTLRYPWYTDDGARQQGYRDYHFINRPNVYRCLAVELVDRASNERRGFFMGVVSQRTPAESRVLKVAHYHHVDPAGVQAVAVAVLRCARAWGVDRVELSDDLAAGLKDSSLLRYLISARERAFVARPKSDCSPLALALAESDLRPDFSDGHYFLMP